MDDTLDLSVFIYTITYQKEVDFLVSDSFKKNIAFEVKFIASGIKASKYKIFRKTYPEFDFQFIEYKASNYPGTISVLKL